MNTLNIGSTYCIRYPKSNALLVCKLITKHEPTLPHEKLLTFEDIYGNKVIITNGVYNKINIIGYYEPPRLPPSSFSFLPLPSQNINIVVQDDDLYN